MDITNKIAIVTGGGRGIGRGIALVMAQNGADVAIVDLHMGDAEAVAAEIAALGRASIAIEADVADQASVDSMVSGVVDRFGRIDILVNNAGVIAAPGWESRDMPGDEDWDLIFAINVRGMARVTETVAPHMRQQRYGKIVNISSIAGRLGSKTSSPYSASKAAVISMTQTAAMDLAEFNINVNAICPGLLWTPMWKRIAARYEKVNERDRGMSEREVFDRYVAERIPLGREQTPEDIGNAAAFLASDVASNITGQALNVSGGSHMN
jgi:meso-butanediol dehydrogenase/(S,S)-butanediol dehydrogenase/diacetyl reductase